MKTPIYFNDVLNNNNLYIKREDFLPFSFGGNKARKAMLFFQEIETGDYDYIVTYGSSSSNHCRVVANMAASKDISCLIISPKENDKETFNKQMMRIFGAKIIHVDINKVKATIAKTLQNLKEAGYRPYFIEGGGHGNIGTQAYVNVYKEIYEYQQKNMLHFDYIFHASGTGTTQAGLICGKLLNKETSKIIGISIARKNPYGGDVVFESVKSYMESRKIVITDEEMKKSLEFIDDYVGKGYGSYDENINDTIKNTLIKYGIPLDTTYTGKAFYGMQEYIRKYDIVNKNILFIHTGGTPLFFNDLGDLL